MCILYIYSITAYNIKYREANRQREMQLHTRHVFITKTILNPSNYRSSFAAIALFNIETLGRNHCRTY